MTTWLQKKLPSNAVEVLRATQMKERAIELINKGLAKSEHLTLNHCYVSKDARVKKKWAKLNQNKDREDDDDDDIKYEESPLDFITLKSKEAV